MLSACGSSSPQVSTAVSKVRLKAAVAATADMRRDAEARAPQGASPTLRSLYAAFPRPEASPQVHQSGAAIRAGISACKGKSPTQVKEQFDGAARPKLSSEQAKMIDRIASFESHSSTDSSFTAGQLAADVYQATLPEGIAQYGYQGCVYALARRLEQKLAPR